MANLKQILFDVKPCILSEITFQDLKQTVNSPINNEEEYKTLDATKEIVEEFKEEPTEPAIEAPKTKTLGTKREIMSQIEKFNARYKL